MISNSKYLIYLTIGFIITIQAFSTEKDKSILGPGDNKTGYENKNYETSSSSYASRKGVKTDLVKNIKAKHLGLPIIDIEESNDRLRKKINLGKKIFFDRRLSLNNTFSCAMCHIPEQGFTSNEMQTAVGLEGRSNLRNAPTILNVAYQKFLFHDGREFSLESQMWQPILSHSEMAMPSLGFTIKKIKLIPGYEELFKEIFPKKGITVETVGIVVASYERSLLSGNSNFDRWYYGKDESAVSEKVKNGFNLFVGKAKCSVCHTINQEYALFFDNKFHNTGVGYLSSMGEKLIEGANSGKKKVQLAPGIYVDVDEDIIKSVTQQLLPNDLGLYRVTENPEHRWLFRTPTLRNVSLTAPYMHNGMFGTLDEVIRFYNKGGINNELLSPFITKLNLTEEEINNLEAFLNSLVGGNIEELVSDALSTPIGEISKDDPHWANEKNMGFD